MARPKNDFTTGEERFLRDHYPTHMPMEQILASLPRHTRNSIEIHARTALGLRRPKTGHHRASPTWDAMRAMLKVEQLTLQQIADRLGISKARVHQIEKERRPELYIAGWIPPKGGGNWTIVWAYGTRKDVPFPGNGAQKKRATTSKACNPFLVAAGLVEIPAGQRGRIYQQPMPGGRLDVEDDELEAA